MCSHKLSYLLVSTGSSILFVKDYIIICFCGAGWKNGEIRIGSASIQDGYEINIHIFRYAGLNSFV